MTRLTSVPGSWLTGETLGSKIVRFAIVGGASAVAYGLLMLAAVEIGHVAPVWATVVCYLLVIPLNFWLQRWFTFRSRDAAGKEIPRYLVVHAMNIGLSFTAMHFVVDVFRADYRWGVMLTVVVVPALVFLALNIWVFKPTRR